MSYQFIVFLFLSFSLYLLVGLSFFLIYSTSQSFNIAHAAIIAFGAYFVFLFVNIYLIGFFLSILLAILASNLISLLCYFFVFKVIWSRKDRAFSF